MRQIVIEPHIRNMANGYLKILRKKGEGRYQTPEERLADFENYLRNNQNLPDYANYVKEIVLRYPIIIRLQPETYEWFHKRYFEPLTRNVDLSRSIKYGATTKKFYEWISDRMRYDDVRSSWLLPFLKKLNIKTCCYCNAQYAVTFIEGTDTMASYDLDHFFPQSKYPYLSTSFFNLVPSCGCCNRHKSNHDDFHYPLYVSRYKHLLQFNLKPESIIKYWLAGDSEKLEIAFSDGKDAPAGYSREYNRVFHISELYTAYVDEVEEMLWKSRVYNAAYREQLKQAFNKLFANDPIRFSRLFFGFYSRESDILMRPLSKMKQDIAKQIDFWDSAL